MMGSKGIKDTDGSKKRYLKMILTFSILSDRWGSLVNINIINMGC